MLNNVVHEETDVRVKICCIQSITEVRAAIDAGAWAIGLVSEMPSGPGPIPESRIAEIAGAVSDEILSVLLTSRTDPADIIEQHKRCRTGAIQLVDELPGGSHAMLRDSLPEIKLIQVIHVTGPDSITAAQSVASEVDMLLLDSGTLSAAVKRLGGTGQTHDWSVSREIVKRSAVPVLLAGGLTPENVSEAIRTVQPYGVDVCSGVRTDGKLDPGILRQFLSTVQPAR